MFPAPVAAHDEEISLDRIVDDLAGLRRLALRHALADEGTDAMDDLAGALGLAGARSVVPGAELLGDFRVRVNVGILGLPLRPAYTLNH